MLVGGNNLHVMSMFLTNMYFFCLVIANDDDNAILHPFVGRDYRGGTVVIPGLCCWNRLS